MSKIFKPSNCSLSILANQKVMRLRLETARFEADDVLDWVKNHSDPGRFSIFPFEERVIGVRKRHRVFAENRACAFCELRIAVGIIESTKKASVPWMLHFYGIRGGHLELFTIDHIVPRSMGGTDELDNLQTSCERCNRYKGNVCTDPFAAAKLRKSGGYYLG